MAQVMPVAFSPTGEYFAYSSPDGTLKLWETATGTLKQEYTPSSHLSATCTCLAWGPSSKSNGSPRKKKKRRSSITLKDDSGRPDLLAIGTTSGSLLVYSLLKGDLHTQLTDGHTEVVNDVCWTSTQEYIYSCSNDRHIVQWCLSTSTVKEKWKADKSSVFCVCLCDSDSHLLSAGRTIKLWDLHTKEVLRTFTGHATEVFRMMTVRHTSDTGGDAAAQVEGMYFLSAAVNDRLINAWQVNTSSRDKTAIASFSLPDEPVYLHLSTSIVSRQAILLLVVTKSGQLVVFEHSLNGRCKKPLKPCVVVQIATEGNNGDVPRQIPVLGASVCGDNVLLVHGHTLKPTFENLPYKSFNSDTCLIRSDPSRTVLHAETSISKIKTPAVSKEATVLCPDYMNPATPARSEGAAASRDKKRRKSHEMSMEERLQVMGVDQAGGQSSSARRPPKTDTMATLLSQGLQSHDRNILSNVLQRTDESLILNTVKGLPVQVIVPLVQELSRRVYGHAHSGQTTLKWLKAVLTLHTSYLMTYPELVALLGRLYQMMDSRVAVFGRLSRLQGKLDLMLSQISLQGQDEEDTDAAQMPMLVYHDDESDEDRAVEDAITDLSGSEDNWEEMSDIDLNGKNTDSEADDAVSIDSMSEDD